MKYLYSILIFSGLFVFAACSSGDAQKTADADQKVPEKPAIQNLNVTEAAQLIDRRPNMILIDVRTPDEYNGPLGHIENARLLPIQQFQNWVPELEGDKDAQIMLICRSGGRSSRTATMLRERGFTNLINVKDGMSAWSAAGLPIAAPE
ncbi:MAG: rhodanese-like domain-containing protein [Calditrichia bacterium]